MRLINITSFCCFNFPNHNCCLCCLPTAWANTPLLERATAVSSVNSSLSLSLSLSLACTQITAMSRVPVFTYVSTSRTSFLPNQFIASVAGPLPPTAPPAPPPPASATAPAVSSSCLLLLCSLSAGLPASFYRCPCNFHVLTLPTLHSLSPL